jgi:hypothetical protein
MNENEMARKLEDDLEDLLAGRNPAGEEGSPEYQQALAAGRRLAGADFNSGYRHREAAVQKMKTLAEKELSRQGGRRRRVQAFSGGVRWIAGAAVLVGLVLGLSILFRSLIPRAGSGTVPGFETAPTPTEMTTLQNVEAMVPLEEASRLVREWYQTQNPDLNPSVEIPLEERTTPEIWNRLEVQVFQVSADIYQYETFLIRAGQVVQLGTAFGGFGVTSLVVSDLDADGRAELLFSYSFGSGIHQSRLGLYRPEDNAVIDPGIRLTNGDLELGKLDDQTIQVYAAFPNQSRELVGSLAYRDEGGQGLVTLTVEPDLSPEVLENLSGDGSYASLDPADLPDTPVPSPTVSLAFTPTITATEALLPSLTPTPDLSYLQSVYLTVEDLGEGWVLEAESYDPSEQYFADRTAGGKAVIWTTRRGTPFWYDPPNVEQVSMRGFSQTEQGYVLFENVVVFSDTAQAEAAFQQFLSPDCVIPCQHEQEYEDGSGDITTFTDPDVGDESMLASVADRMGERPRYFAALIFRKGTVLVTLYSQGISMSEMDDLSNGPVLEDEFLEAAARILEARIS